MTLNRSPGPTVAGSELPKMKQTTLGLYVTAAQSYEMWKAAPDKVKIIDVRTPEEFAFVGHPEMAWNVPVAFVTYERKEGKFTYGPKMNGSFVAQVREMAQPSDILLVTCRSGGRGAMAVNQLAAPASPMPTTSSMGSRAIRSTIPRVCFTARG